MLRVLFSHLSFVILSILIAFSVEVAKASKTTFTLGYLRMAESGLDSPNTLAGYQALIRQANENNWYPHAHFVLNVTTIGCSTILSCRSLTASQTQQINDFLAAMGGFTAVIKPNYLLTVAVNRRSTQLGNVPIIDDVGIESNYFGPEFDHLINFGHNVSRYIDHLFTYMQLKLNCAYTGILHGTLVPGLSHNVDLMSNHIQTLFSNAGRAIPPRIDVQGATDEQLANFIMYEEPRRRCFVFISPYAVLNALMERLSRMPGYSPRKYSYLAMPYTASDSFLFNGTTNLTSRVTFAHWSPPDISPTLRAAFTEWNSTPRVSELQAFAPSEAVPNTIQFYTVQASHVIQLVMSVINTVASQWSSAAFDLCNASAASTNSSGPPIPWSTIVDGFYQTAHVIDRFKFSPLIKDCPPKPQKQVCFCNSLSRMSFLYEVNVSTGKPQAVYDDATAGERDVASLELTESSCGYESSSWSYPITNVVVLPSIATGTSSLRADEIIAIIQFFQSIYRALTADVNYARVKYPRSFRYTEISTDAGQLNESVFEEYLDGINPFIILGSMAERINNSDVLTLVPSLMEIETEDPVLVPHGPGGWKWNILQLEPSLADLIHGLVAFYKEVMMEVPTVRGLNSKAKFTSIHAIASTQREAELVSLSFATWGYNVPASDVIVSSDPHRWTQQVTAWLSNSDSSNPFVLAASAGNQNSVILAAASAATITNRGTLAMAASNAAIRSASLTLTFAPGSADSSDVIFGSMSDEFWMYDVNFFPSSVRAFTQSPRFNLAYLSMTFATQLAAEVWYNFQATAAQVLYAKGTITALTTAFGPFSNASCTAAQIASNTRDRTCQCVKGARTIFTHSLRAYVGRTYSDSTGRFSWTMSTCGVVYTPYVPPTGSDGRVLSAGAIAGIAVGSTLLLFVLAGGYILSVCFLGRNNRNAPKDPTKPFAVVFTDIQSSTALWSRAPAAMSESIEKHHELMRKALRRNNGYEVKTVGDSFMIAFHDSDDAVKFALDIQLALYEAEWNKEIDAIYLELMAEAAESADAEEKEENNAKEFATTDAPGEQSIIVPGIGSTVMMPSYYNTNGTHIRTEHVSMISDVGDKMEQSLNSQISPGYVMQPADSQQQLQQLHQLHPAGSAVQMKRPVIVNFSYVDNANQSIASAHGLATNNLTDPEDYPHRRNNTDQSITTQNNNNNATASVVLSQQQQLPTATPENDPTMWHGLRVRIGINYGMGDIRKDPTTLGYDYYGTVVNTAARVEGVGHGGQTLVTEDAYTALSSNLVTKNKAVVIALGAQPLRGLDAPVKLFQLVPFKLSRRTFPQLRLHIEKETEDTSTANTGTANGAATPSASEKTDVETVDELVARLFATSKQYGMTTPEEVLYNYHFLETIFSPVKEKFRNSVTTKLAETWGFEKNQIGSGMSNGNANKIRFLVALTAKMTKTFVVGGRGNGTLVRDRKYNKNMKERPIYMGETRSVASTSSSRRRNSKVQYHFLDQNRQLTPQSSQHPLSNQSFGGEPKSLI